VAPEALARHGLGDNGDLSISFWRESCGANFDDDLRVAPAARLLSLSSIELMLIATCCLLLSSLLIVG
jgi:hypothetical protein